MVFSKMDSLNPASASRSLMRFALFHLLLVLAAITMPASSFAKTPIPATRHADGLSTIIFGLTIGSEKQLGRSENLGVVWRQYDPRTGDLLDPVLSPYTYLLQWEHDPDCAFISCDAGRKTTIIYSLPLGHYVMSRIFVYGVNDQSGAQIFDLLGDRSNVEGLKLPRFNLARTRTVKYLGDFTFKATFVRKKPVKAGKLGLPSEATEYRFDLARIENNAQDLPKLKQIFKLKPDLDIKFDLDNAGELASLF